MRRVLVRAAGLWLLLALQASIAPHLEVAGAPPDLPLVAVLVWAMADGPVVGASAGLATGLALDLLRGDAIGLFALAAACAGALCGFAATRVDPARFVVRFVLAAAASALYGGVVAIGWWLLVPGSVQWLGAAHHLLVSSLWDACLVAAAYGIWQGWVARSAPPAVLRPPAARHW